jgi:NAD(P)-dependent dehydrogenase (short-subunit alcohol dehydrogenase family)
MAYEKLQLTGRTAVVIGATSGIGRVLAKGLAQAGANVIATGRRAELVKEVAAEIRALGVRSLEITCDVTSRESLRQLLAAVIKEFAAVDILVYAAGKIKRTPTLQVTEEEWNGIIDTNLNGALRACQVFGAHMVERRYGRIINIASVATFLALYEVAAYAASKAALGMLTKSLAIEWARYGVCVNAIAPGFFLTELNAGLLNGTPRGQEAKMRTPMGRFGNLDELVGAAVFLASESASFVTGHVLAVDGGFLASGVNQ